MEINAGITLNKEDLNNILKEYFTDKGYIIKGDIDIPEAYLLHNDIQIGVTIDVQPLPKRSGGPIIG